MKVHKFTVYAATDSKPAMLGIPQLRSARIVWIHVLIIVFSFHGTSSDIIPLSRMWKITDGNISINWQPINGADVLSAMVEEGLIKNPLEGYGDTEYRNISQRYWTFSTEFPTFFLDEEKKFVFLELDEVDLFAWVSVNKRFVFYTSNSFVKSTYPIGQFLVDPPALNLLELQFLPTQVVASYLARRTQNPPPPTCWPPSYHGECHVNMVRTTQASFGWDWGPAFPIQGFWQIPRILSVRNLAYLGEGILFYPILKSVDDHNYLWNAKVSVEIIMVGQGKTEWFCLETKIDGLMFEWASRCFFVSDIRVNPSFFMFHDQTAIPWWPNGVHSGPKVYNLQIHLKNDYGRIIDSAYMEVGFRQVELLQVSC